MNEHKDYRVTVRVRNNNILKLIEGKGVSGTEVAKEIGMAYSTLSRYIQLRESPITAQGTVKQSAQRLCDYFGMMVEEVWSLEQLTPIECNIKEVEFSYQELTRLENISNPILSLANDQLKEQMDVSLDKLDPREAMVLRLRFGLEGDVHTTKEIGDMLGITSTRIGQIEAKALRKLRHPSRSGVLLTFLNDGSETDRKAAEREKIQQTVKEWEQALSIWEPV